MLGDAEKAVQKDWNRSPRPRPCPRPRRRRRLMTQLEIANDFKKMYKVGVTLRVEGRGEWRRGEWRRRNRAKELINLFFFARLRFPSRCTSSNSKGGRRKDIGFVARHVTIR